MFYNANLMSLFKEGQLQSYCSSKGNFASMRSPTELISTGVLQDHSPSVGKKVFVLFCDWHLKNSAQIPHLNSFLVEVLLQKENHTYLKHF